MSVSVTFVLFSLMAKYPASVTAAFISAPLNPSISLLIFSKFIFPNFMFFVWILNISFLPSSFGRGTCMSLSNLPGLVIAGSRTSFLFVQPIIFTFPNALKPSISASSCMNVLWTSLSPLVPNSILVAAIASISSMNIIDGAFSLASWNISLTSFAPSPMNFCTSSEPTTSMNVLSVLAATAFASKVLPVPGGP